MNYISDILYWISTGLLVPVIVLLIILLVVRCCSSAVFRTVYVDSKTESLLRGEFDSLTPGGIASLGERIPNVRTSLVTVYIHRMLEVRNSRPHVERLLADFEIAADKDLAISKTLTKMGPMLGLMGTLIPMGPALVGLSAGDISSMAYNMQVAFATTVVGLFASAIGFITQQVKQRWYLQDMTNLEFLAEIMKEEGKCVK